MAAWFRIVWNMDKSYLNWQSFFCWHSLFAELSELLKTSLFGLLSCNDSRTDIDADWRRRYLRG